MIGTLIKTKTDNGFFIGLVKDYRYNDDEISVDVVWNDCDNTTETFEDYEDYESCIYHFHDNGRWWRVDTNFYMFKQVLEGKCK
jgi:hypothetical protein